LNRRTFLKSTAAAGSVPTLFAAPMHNVPVIDTHIHLFDANRPQGVPWPPKDSPIPKSSLPDAYRKLAAPHGVVGAIAIECSPWDDDNEWVLGVAEHAPIIVGTIGNLEPGSTRFGNRLEKLHRNPLFRGIRCGNLWDRDLDKDISKAGAVSDLKLLAKNGLVLDTANPDPALMGAVVRLADLVQDLGIIIDHLPELTPPSDAAARKACDAHLRRLAARPKVYAKISGIVRREDGRVPLDLAFYRDRLDHIWELFGPDKLLFGSDYPNSELWATYPQVFKLAQEFIRSKDAASVEKIYWRNSLKAYRWVKRDPAQPMA
jgi:L-fuconolactonase